ncbi:Mg2 transporter protein CorA family protein [Fictibacillus macauensis ZFHKF-1]|uniref:Mg2 transporter protein CorA family protein n=1 Tax=Fictibacillus macauensis ZFHKF-1 TaxID=1196324 RepID=I8AL68_9BACL|nr:magnesium transporter CorA family protein [Fictibacillus macauensis]EIT86354.1 Mg2 transporter protein CorA family protein [Fictibacillus macauensis ZFHKF-1]
MLKVYYTESSNQLVEKDEIQKGCWINLIAPTNEEIEHVVEKIGIDPDFIRDALDEEERSRAEKDGSTVSVIVDLPVIASDENGIQYDTLPLAMITTDSYFITVCLRDNPILELFAKHKVKNFYTYKKTRFVFQLLQMIATYYLRYLRQINRKTEQIETELRLSLKNNDLFELLSLEKSLVYFATSLKSNDAVLEKLLKVSYLKMYEEDKDLLEDVIIENKQAIEMSLIYSNILKSLMDAFSSVISNNLNIEMRFLTAITIILALPTMVASFYGMNIPLPFQESSHAFLIVICIVFSVAAFAAFIFWKKRFFRK